MSVWNWRPRVVCLRRGSVPAYCSHCLWQFSNIFLAYMYMMRLSKGWHIFHTYSFVFSTHFLFFTHFLFCTYFCFFHVFLQIFCIFYTFLCFFLHFSVFSTLFSLFFVHFLWAFTLICVFVFTHWKIYKACVINCLWSGPTNKIRGYFLQDGWVSDRERIAEVHVQPDINPIIHLKFFVPVILCNKFSHKIFSSLSH